MRFNEKLQALRKECHTQEELTEKCHVSRQAVSKWEAGAAMPDIDNIVTLSDIFGVTMDSLFKEGRALPAQAGDEGTRGGGPTAQAGDRPFMKPNKNTQAGDNLAAQAGAEPTYPLPAKSDDGLKIARQWAIGLAIGGGAGIVLLILVSAVVSVVSVVRQPGISLLVGSGTMFGLLLFFCSMIAGGLLYYGVYSKTMNRGNLGLWLCGVCLPAEMLWGLFAIRYIFWIAGYPFPIPVLVIAACFIGMLGCTGVVLLFKSGRYKKVRAGVLVFTAGLALLNVAYVLLPLYQRIFFNRIIPFAYRIPQKFVQGTSITAHGIVWGLLYIIVWLLAAGIVILIRHLISKTDKAASAAEVAPDASEENAAVPEENPAARKTKKFRVWAIFLPLVLVGAMLSSMGLYYSHTYLFFPGTVPAAITQKQGFDYTWFKKPVAVWVQSFPLNNESGLVRYYLPDITQYDYLARKMADFYADFLTKGTYLPFNSPQVQNPHYSGTLYTVSLRCANALMLPMQFDDVLDSDHTIVQLGNDFYAVSLDAKAQLLDYVRETYPIGQSA